MNSGIFLINKDKGLSSNKAIQKIKRRLDIKKIGHFGTLDPLAEGLLVCGVNKGTKLSERFLNLDKSYFSKIIKIFVREIRLRCLIGKKSLNQFKIACP